MIFMGQFASAFLEVLAIIGIIVVGGFVIFFLGDLVLSVLDPNYVRFGHKKKTTEEKETKEQVKQLTAPKEETPALEFKFDDENTDDFFLKEEEVKVPVESIQVEEPAVEEAKEDGLKDLRAEEEAFRANMLKAIEERRQAKGNQDEEYKNFFFDDEDINVFEDEDKFEEAEKETAEEAVIEGQENIENIIETPVEETPVEEMPEIIEETAQPIVIAPIETSVETSNEEIEKLKAQFQNEIERLRKEKAELEAKLNNEETETTPTLSLEEYEARLAVLQDRLAKNEKEFRKVKKEFIPLCRISKALESDEKKLRKREAVVAKQKVVLYGVNNIVDIDEEKAKKLAEDLDLLEGLRLSVQHCEEVMAKNKERYPILENTFNILESNNETLKADIKEVEKAIAELKATAND